MKKLEISQLHLIMTIINKIYNNRKRLLFINFIYNPDKKAVIAAFIYILCVENGLYYNK